MNGQPGSTRQETTMKTKKPRTKSAKRQTKRQAPAESASKKKQVLALLKQPEGATLADMIAATGRQAHSVGGFLSGNPQHASREA